MKSAIPNFDCADIYQEHGYLVRLTSRSTRAGRDAKVQVFEVFGRAPTERETQWAPETVLRCEAPRDVWDIIAPELRSEFNLRLKAEGKPAGRWGADETAVQRLLGKELLVLLWAAELPDVTPEELLVAYRNWLGLKPEERWWLYTMTAAATGLAHHAGMGWRGALRKALCFGTRQDAFHLGAVAGRGTLAPRSNPDAAAVAASKAKPKKAKAVTQPAQPQEASAPKKRASKPKAPKADAAATVKKTKPTVAASKPKSKRARAAPKTQTSLFDLPAAAE